MGAILERIDYISAKAKETYNNYLNGDGGKSIAEFGFGLSNIELVYAGHEICNQYKSADKDFVFRIFNLLTKNDCIK